MQVQAQAMTRRATAPWLAACDAVPAGHGEPVPVADRLRACRLAFEARADEWFMPAWAGLHGLAVPVQQALGALRQPSGLWRDFLAATACWPLDLPLLLLDDLGLPEGMARDHTERQLFNAAALQAAAVVVSEAVLAGDGCADHAHTLLVHGLLARAQWALRATLPQADAAGAQALRTLALAHWNEHASAIQAHRQRRALPRENFTPRALARLGQRWAPMKTAVLAAAACAGRLDLAPMLEPLLDEAAALYQLGREQTAVTPALARDTRARCDRLLAAVGALGLPQLRAGLAPLALPWRQVARSTPRRAAAAAVCAAQPHTLAQAATAADAYLRSDPAQHEAWEVYRWGYLDQPELTSRVFPLGVMLEQRIAAGDDGAFEVDALFALYARNRCHYFDRMSMQPPDSDTLALMLRLAPHGRNVALCRSVLEVPLRWLLGCVAPDGSMPVFMTRGLGDDAQGPYLNMTARDCAGVQAGLLSGLLACDASRFQSVLLAGSLHTLGWFAKAGSAALTHYDVPCGALCVLALADALRRHRPEPVAALQGDALWPQVQAAAVAAERRAVDLLQARRALSQLSTQDAALLQLASAFPAAAALHSDTWLQTLLRRQQPDGGFDAGALYLVPNRGNQVSWYASRRVTTAFAYRALAESNRHGHPRRPARCAHNPLAAAGLRTLFAGPPGRPVVA